VETREDFLIWRRKAEAPASEVGNLLAKPRAVRPGSLLAEPRVVKAASLRAEARPGSLGADFKGPRAVNLVGADWVKQAQLPGE
jgi:hypothetical protein